MPANSEVQNKGTFFESSQSSSSSEGSLESCKVVCQSGAKIIAAYLGNNLRPLFLKVIFNEVEELSGYFLNQKTCKFSSEKKNKLLKDLDRSIARIDRLAKSLKGEEVFYDIEDSDDTPQLNTSNNTGCTLI